MNTVCYIRNIFFLIPLENNGLYTLQVCFPHDFSAAEYTAHIAIDRD